MRKAIIEYKRLTKKHNIYVLYALNLGEQNSIKSFIRCFLKIYNNVFHVTYVYYYYCFHVEFFFTHRINYMVNTALTSKIKFEFL